VSGDSPPSFHYRPPVLEALEGHGIRPRAQSDPRKVYELLKTIYVWEIRKLKADFRRVDPGFERSMREAYAEANRRLLERYAVLRIPPHEWVEG